VYKLHEIWSTDSQESHSNCCHEISHFKAVNAPNSISAGAPPQTPLAELTVQSGFNGGLLLRGGEGKKGERRGGKKGRREGKRGGRVKEKERKGRTGPPQGFSEMTPLGIREFR